MPKAYVDQIMVKAIQFAQEHLGPSATVTRMQVMKIVDGEPVLGVHWDVGVDGTDSFAWAILGSGPSFRVAVNRAVERSKR